MGLSPQVIPYNRWDYVACTEGKSFRRARPAPDCCSSRGSWYRHWVETHRRRTVAGISHLEMKRHSLTHSLTYYTDIPFRRKTDTKYDMYYICTSLLLLTGPGCSCWSASQGWLPLRRAVGHGARLPAQAR